MVKTFASSRADRVDMLSSRLLGCEPAFALWLLGFQLWLALLWFYYQGFGVARGLILCGLLAGLMALRFGGSSRPAVGLPRSKTLTPVLRTLLVATLLLDLAMMFVSTSTSVETGKIPMDEGQTSWRAARLLWQGGDPYGPDALVDFGAYRSRVPQRIAAGISSPLTDPALSAELARYDATFDPGTRIRLGIASVGENTATAREIRLYGYKYGPVVLLITALIVPFGIPAAVLLLNGLACFALYGAAWRLLKRIATPELALAGAAMLALLLDRHITRNYIDRSATDVWALLFGALAVLAFTARRPFGCATAIAFAIGCKSMPGLLFAPLLLRFRTPTPALVCAGLTLLLYLPWLVWDARGVVYNVFLWPFFMATDYTSWEYFAPPWATFAARVIIVCAIALLWGRFILGRELRLFWTLAVSSTLVLLASGFLRNGYVPWASLWAVMAVAESFTAGSDAVRARAAGDEIRQGSSAGSPALEAA